MIFSNKKTYKSNENFKLQIINENEEFIDKSLGITESRKKELSLLCLSTYKEKNKNLVLSLEATVNVTKHINEAVFVTLMISKLHDADRKHLLDILTEILGMDE